MPPKRRSGFFAQESRPQDDAARQQDLAAVLTTRHTFPQDVAVDLIDPNPFQARHSFTALDELAETMRQHGFTSRLRIRPDPAVPGRFQLLYGERRLRAARLADLETIPCDVAEHTDDDLIEIGLAENIQRHDLDPLEEAHAFQIFIQERGYSIRRLAARIGKDKSYIEDRLTLLRTPADVQEMIAQRPDSLRAAREIAKLETPAARQPLIAGVLAGDLNTTNVRTLVREVHPAAPPRRAAQSELDIIERDARTLQMILERWAELATLNATARARVTSEAAALLQLAQRLLKSLAE